MMKCLIKVLLVILGLMVGVSSGWAQLYVANREEGTVSEYDASTGALIKGALISGLQGPHGLALDGDVLYVTEPMVGTVAKYNVRTGEPIAQAFITGVGSPQGIAVSNNAVYVTVLDGGATGTIGKYNAETGAAINAALIPRLPGISAVAVSGNRVYVAHGDGDGAVGIYDIESGAMIQPSVAPFLTSPDSLVTAGNYLWVSGMLGVPSGAVGRYDISPNAGGMQMTRPYITGVTGRLALSGDDLFVASLQDGIIRRYNAASGALINASFIAVGAGLSGIVAVAKASTQAPALWNKARAVDTVEMLFGYQSEWIICGLVLLLVLAVVILVGVYFMRTRKAVPEGETPAKGFPLKWVLIGGSVLTVLLIGGYMAYSVAMSYYYAAIIQARMMAQAQMQADQMKTLPAPLPVVAPTRLERKPILVDPENYRTENNWLASMIGQRIAEFVHLALVPGEIPEIKVQAQVKVAEGNVHLEITGFSKDKVVADLHPDFAWDPQGYAPLATQLIGTAQLPAVKPEETLPDELTILQQLTGPTLAKEDMALSALLQKYPTWAYAHEDAALLLVAMAIRVRAGQYTDYRQMLSLATAHLALAQAFRGAPLPSWAGEIADAGIRALSGREVDALAKLDALAARNDCPAAAKDWISALRLRAKDDWRMVTANPNSSLLLKIAWFQVLNNNLTSLAAERRLFIPDNPDEISDWGHAALDNNAGGAVETGNRFANATLIQEINELGEVLKLENTVPDPTVEIGALLSEPLRPKLFAGQPPTLKIIGPEMFKAFARQHLLMELGMTYYWLKDELGVPDEAEKFRAQAWEKFSGMRGFEKLGFFAQDFSLDGALHELAKRNTTWEPWESTEGYLLNNPTLAPHPDIDTLYAFYQDGLPFGTAYELESRNFLLGTAANYHRKQLPESIHYNPDSYPYAKDLQKLAPSSFTAYFLDHDDAQLFKDSRPWWDYNLVSIYAVEEKRNSLDDEDYVMLMEKHAALVPDVYFQLGDHLRKEGKDDAAAVADQKGVDQAFDQVGLSNSVGPLVDYYYDHDQKQKAEMVAKKAADVYSQIGLFIYLKFLKREGRLDEAEVVAKNIADRYKDNIPLNQLYTEHADHFPEQNKTLFNKRFPNGLEKVELSSLVGPPSSGITFTSSSETFAQAGLEIGDVVVALDGYRVGNDLQYEYVRDLKSDPKMDMIIWRNDHYVEFHAEIPYRRFNVDLETYPKAKK